MSVSELLYVARQEAQEQIVRGVDNILQQPMYDAGALVGPTAATSTCTVYDATNTVVATPTVSVVSTVARATLLAASTSSQSLSEGWRVDWSLTMPDGTQRLVPRDAVLCRKRLLPPATWADVFRREPSLDPSADSVIHKLTLAQLDPFLDEAWLQIEAKLIANGRRPWLVIGAQAFRETLICGVLSLVFQSFATRLKAAYVEQARMYAEMRDRAWPDLRFAYDTNDDGAADGGSVPAKVGATGSVWLGSSRAYHRGKVYQ